MSNVEETSGYNGIANNILDTELFLKFSVPETNKTFQISKILKSQFKYDVIMVFVFQIGQSSKLTIIKP